MADIALDCEPTSRDLHTQMICDAVINHTTSLKCTRFVFEDCSSGIIHKRRNLLVKVFV